MSIVLFGCRCFFLSVYYLHRVQIMSPKDILVKFQISEMVLSGWMLIHPETVSELQLSVIRTGSISR